MASNNFKFNFHVKVVDKKPLYLKETPKREINNTQLSEYRDDLPEMGNISVSSISEINFKSDNAKILELHPLITTIKEKQSANSIKVLEVPWCDISNENILPLNRIFLASQGQKFKK